MLDHIYTSDNLKKLCTTAIEIIRQAGIEILAHYNSFDASKDITLKPDKSPVTVADLASNKVIFDGLSNLLLDGKLFKLPILSEEDSDDKPAKLRQEWTSYWLLDPLDGTKEFINKNGEFSINLALIHHNRPIMGIIYAPYFDILYYAIENQGAYKVTCSSEPIVIKTNKINHVNNKLNINIATSRRHHKTSKYNKFVKKLISNNMDCNAIFSGSAIKFGLVAEGVSDIYPRFGLTYEWDVAAGDCILQEAGGALCKLDGSRFKYNSHESLINPEFYAVGDNNFDWQKYI